MRNRVKSLLLVALVALAVSGCVRRAGHEPESFSWNEDLAPGSVLHIRSGTGTITVAAVPGPTARIRASRSWRRGRSSDIRFQVTRSGDRSEVYVCAMWRASGRCDANGYRGKRVDTFLSFLSLFHRTTDAAASFIVEVPEGVGVDAKTTNGSVVIDGVRSGVTARTVNGSVSARGVGGRLNLATTSGNVRLSVTSLDGADTIRAVTVHGTVHAELPASTQGAFDLAANNGRVRSEFPIQTSEAPTGRRQHIVGRIGDANRVVRLRATTGSVALIKALPDSAGERH
jgi:hypothetical protein